MRYFVSTLEYRWDNGSAVETKLYATTDKDVINHIQAIAEDYFRDQLDDPDYESFVVVIEVKLELL